MCIFYPIIPQKSGITVFVEIYNDKCTNNFMNLYYIIYYIVVISIHKYGTQTSQKKLAANQFPQH